MLDTTMLTHLQTWTGKTEELHDQATLAPVRGLSATLDRLEDPSPRVGDSLPTLWHWLYFLPSPMQREIGPDGHPNRGGFLPPVPLPRRMWAGSRMDWSTDNPIRLGQNISRLSTIKSVSHKAGRSGDLVFVCVQHQVSNDKGVCLVEEHDIVYRPPAQANDPVPKPTPANKGAVWNRNIVPDDVLLFRYSALTFNGHRIHYDRDYVTKVEGYPGLIVHGPLIATLLIDLARRNAPDRTIKHFEFRAIRPTFDLNPFAVNGQPSADGKSALLWANDHDGWLTMDARIDYL